METVSKKRGRPEVFVAGWVKLIRGLHPEIKTARGISAKCYECQAVGALKVDGVVVDGVSAIFSATNTYQATVLEQLGRLQLYGDEA